MGLRVPQSRGPEVAPSVTPGIRTPMSAPLAAFGGGQEAEEVTRQARGLAADGRAAYEDQARQEAARAHALRMSETVRALNDYEARKLHDPQKGLLNRRGKDAIPVTAEFTQDFDGWAREYEGGLANERQREDFRRIAQGRRDHSLRLLSNHVAQESFRYEDQEQIAQLESAKTRAGLDPTGEVRSMELQRIRDVVDRRAQVRGWSPEVRALELQKQEADLHSRVLSRMLRDRSPEARGYYDSVKGALLVADPEAAGRFEDAVKLEDSRQAAAAAVAEIMEGGVRERQGEGGMETVLIQPARTKGEALERVAKIEDEQAREIAARKVEAAWRARSQVQEERYAADLETAAQLVDRNGDLDSVPADLMARLNVDDRQKLRKLSAGYAPVDDPKALASLAALEAAPEKLAALTMGDMLTRYKSKLTDTGFKTALKMWSGAVEAVKGGKVEKYQSLISDSDRILRALHGTGAGGITKSDTWETIKDVDEKSQFAWRFREEVDRRMLERQRASGKNLDDAGKAEVISGVAKDFGKEITVRSYAPFGIEIGQKKVKLGDLDLATIGDNVIDMDWKTRQGFYNFALSEGIAPKGGNLKKWEDANRERVNRAWLEMELRGAGPEKVANILRGK